MEDMKKNDWNFLFAQALSEPGILSRAYSIFHEFSLGNCILAASQLKSRGLPLSPIATYKKWQELGRQVKKGEKALALCMPIIINSKSEKEDSSEEEDDERQEKKAIFVLKRKWFSLYQTEGKEYCPENTIPSWNKEKALAELKITEEPFAHINGNAQGYSRPNARVIAINPLAKNPWKTIFHEIAHCLLHSSEALMSDNENISASIREAEAESVAYLLCATLGLPGLEESRGYIQGWLRSEEQREEFKKSAARVFSVANKILKAGQPKNEEKMGRND